MEFLIIDDDKIFRDAACLLIEDAGHHAEGAANSEAGLLRLKEDNFDAVLLDLNLGAEDGLAVLSRISETHPRVPVVMVTAPRTISRNRSRGSICSRSSRGCSGFISSVGASTRSRRRCGRRVRKVRRRCLISTRRS
jgi:CheY-like chemotaxis protein